MWAQTRSKDETVNVMEYLIKPSEIFKLLAKHIFCERQSKTGYFRYLCRKRIISIPSNASKYDREYYIVKSIKEQTLPYIGYTLTCIIKRDIMLGFQDFTDLLYALGQALSIDIKVLGPGKDKINFYKHNMRPFRKFKLWVGTDTKIKSTDLKKLACRCCRMHCIQCM